MGCKAQRRVSSHMNNTKSTRIYYQYSLEQLIRHRKKWAWLALER